jgi:hypothetical protein
MNDQERTDWIADLDRAGLIEENARLRAELVQRDTAIEGAKSILTLPARR